MKTMNCSKLDGVRNKESHADTFGKIAELNKKHEMETFSKEDSTYQAALGKMQELMKDPKEMDKWFELKRKQFEALPQD